MPYFLKQFKACLEKNCSKSLKTLPTQFMSKASHQMPQKEKLPTFSDLLLVLSLFDWYLATRLHMGKTLLFSRFNLRSLKTRKTLTSDWFSASLTLRTPCRQRFALTLSRDTVSIKTTLWVYSSLTPTNSRITLSPNSEKRLSLLSSQSSAATSRNPLKRQSSFLCALYPLPCPMKSDL